MFLGAISFASPLAMAAWLRPNPAGLGTHQQLGLPPCSIRMVWGIRCPACGMTTSWSHFVRGEMISSLRANLAGALLAILVSVAVVVLVSGCWTGRTPGRGWLVAAAWGMILILTIAVADWAWRSV
jgi:hypothetical protein